MNGSGSGSKPRARVMGFCPVRVDDLRLLELVMESHDNLTGVDEWVYVNDCTPGTDTHTHMKDLGESGVVTVLNIEDMPPSEYVNHDWAAPGRVERIARIRNIG